MLKDFNRIYSIEIDINNLEKTYSTKAIFSSGDKNTSTLLVRILNRENSFDLTDCTITALFNCADGEKYKQDAIILEPTNGCIAVDLKTDVLQKGLNTFALKIVNNEGDIIYTPLLSYKVVSSILDGMDASNEKVSLIESILNDVELTRDNINKLREQILEKLNDFDRDTQIFLINIREEIDELKLSIKDGETPNIAIGKVTSLSHGENATVSNTGDKLNPIFNFGIPEGRQGEQGIQGEKGDKGDEYDDTEIRGLISSLSKRIELLENQSPPTEVTDIKLLYNFNNLNRGYADGTISLQTSGEANAGKYYIKWADENGELSEYEEITVFEMFGVNAIQTYNFIKLNLIPVEASRIVAIKDNVIKASFNIPSNKRITDSKKLSFGLISDMHVDGSGGSSSEANDDFVRALKYFDSKNVDMNILTGDAVNNGLLVDLEAFKNLKESSTNVPLYVCRGNHDTYNDCNIDNFTTYIEENGLHFEKEIKGDKYLFIGLNAENFTTPFKSESMEWLKSKLEEYKNQRVFLMQHVFVGETGNIAGLYPHSDGFDMTAGTRSREFVDLLSKYRNVIMFTGHSHLDFNLQRLGENANVALRTKTLCHRVHTPSTSKPRKNDINTEDIPDNTYTYREGSQGYLVDVYDDYIVLHGIDFEKGLLLPYAQYILDTTPILIEDDINTSYEHKLLSEITSLSLGSLSSTGEDRTSSSSYRTDFIELNECDNKTFILPRGLTYVRICIYDENKAFLKLNEENDNNEISSTVDEVRNLENIAGAKYIKLKGQGDLENIRFNGSI